MTRTPPHPPPGNLPTLADAERTAVPFETGRADAARYARELIIHKDTLFVWDHTDGYWRPVTDFPAEVLDRVDRQKVPFVNDVKPTPPAEMQAKASKRLQQKKKALKQQDQQARRGRRYQFLRDKVAVLSLIPLLRWVLTTRFGFIFGFVCLTVGLIVHAATFPGSTVLPWIIWGGLTLLTLPLLTLGKSGEVSGAGSLAAFLIICLSGLIALYVFGLHAIVSAIAG